MREAYRRALKTAVLLLGFGLASPALPENITAENTAAVKESEHHAFSKKGADSCLKCHDEDSVYPVLDIFKTAHARKGDPRTPFANQQCESCHGPSGEHAGRVRPGEERPPPPAFGPHSSASASEQNANCLSCHQDHGRMGWTNSAHESADQLCSSCHVVHRAHDPVLDTATQAEQCYDCHEQVRHQAMQLSAHPIRQAQMTCSDCHDVHGGMAADALLKRATLNETCYGCHAEKRGPFLWEHAPASEDCSSCHQPHGSMHPALLTRSKPLLCQSCHSQADHPSIAYTPDGLPSGTPNAFLLMNSCSNCHSQVHGSNHPSGAKLMR